MSILTRRMKPLGTPPDSSPMTSTSITVGTVDRVILIDWNLFSTALELATSALIVGAKWNSGPYHQSSSVCIAEAFFLVMQVQTLTQSIATQIYVSGSKEFSMLTGFGNSMTGRRFDS